MNIIDCRIQNQMKTNSKYQHIHTKRFGILNLFSSFSYKENVKPISDVIDEIVT